MSDIGARLREAREAQGLTLAQVEQGTRIRERFLAAMEENRFEDLPGQAHARGFLRNYASFLGIDPAPLLEELGPSPSQVKLPLPTQPVERRLLSEPLQPNPVPFARILFTLGVLVLLGALAFSLWWQPAQRDAILARVGITLPQVNAEPTASPTLALPTATIRVEPAAAPVTHTQVVTQTTIIIAPNGAGQEEATPVPTATLPPRTPTAPPESPTPEPPPPTATPETQRIVLTAQIVDRTWTEVYIDSQSEPLVYRVLEPGESFEWVGEQELYLRVGNAAGISVTLNGEDLGILGGQGGLVVRRWQRNPEGGPPLLVESQG